MGKVIKEVVRCALLLSAEHEGCSQAVTNMPPHARIIRCAPAHFARPPGVSTVAFRVT